MEGQVVARPGRAGPASPAGFPFSWGSLVGDVLETGTCSGCGGCVVACPRGVLDLDQESWRPRLAAEARVVGSAEECVYAARGCSMCARACPRFGPWEREADVAVRGRARDGGEVFGVYQRLYLAAATDPEISAAGQDGGLATGLLAYALEQGVIDAALVSYAEKGMRPRPGVARSRAEAVAAAGSRYTYSANLIAASEAVSAGAARLGLVSVGCQASVPAVAGARGARRLAGRFALTIGLFCSCAFTDELFSSLLVSRGINRDQVTRMNVKGRLQVWAGSPAGDDPDLEVPLRECHSYDRPGCRHCPDFAAQHADVSLGGIGSQAGMTLAVVRSDLGVRLLEGMERDGRVRVVDAEREDPGAVALLARMAGRQRRRWAAFAAAIPGIDPGPGVSAAE